MSDDLKLRAELGRPLTNDEVDGNFVLVNEVSQTASAAASSSLAVAGNAKTIAEGAQQSASDAQGLAAAANGVAAAAKGTADNALETANAVYGVAQGAQATADSTGIALSKYSGTVANNAATLQYAEGSTDGIHPVVVFEGTPAPISIGIRTSNGDLFARFPVNDSRIKANVDARLVEPLAQLVTYESQDPKIVVLHADSEGRALLWADYRADTQGVYFLGKKLGSGNGVGGTYRGVIDNGQSNSVGQAGTTRSIVYGESYPYPEQVLMLGSSANNIWLGAPGSSSSSRQILDATVTGLVPLRSVIASTNAHATTSAEGYLYAAAAQARPFAAYDGYVAWNTTEGNQSIINMLNDAPAGNFYFANQVFCTQKTVDLLSDRGARFTYDWMLMAQGEANTSLENLGQLHNLLRSQLQDAIRPITQQAGPIRMLSYQMSSFTSSNGGVRSILDEALAQPELWATFLCAGPTYIFPFNTDFLHSTSVGHARRGEYSHAIIKQFEASGSYRPLHALSATVTDTRQITVTLSEEAVNDPNWLVTDRGNAGISLSGGSVTGVTVAGNTVIIDTNSDAINSTAVNFALAGQSSPRTESNIPRSTIRSVAAIGEWSATAGGGAMYKPMCHQSIAISA